MSLAELQGLLIVLPAGVNPFDWAAQHAEYLVLAKATDAESKLLLALAIVYTVFILISLVTIVNRWISDALWVFRRQRGVLHAHMADIVPISLALFFALGAADLYLFYILSRVAPPPYEVARACVVLLGISWLPLAGSVWFELTELFHDVVGRPSTQNAGLLNTLSTAPILLGACVPIALSIAAVVQGLNPVLSTLGQLELALQSLDRSASFDQETLAGVLPLVAQLHDRVGSFGRWLRVLFIPWAVAVIVLLLGGAFVHLQHFAKLGARLRVMRSTHKDLVRYRGEAGTLEAATEADTRIVAALSNYIWRAISLIGMTIAGFCLAAIILILVIDPHTLLADDRRLFGCILGAYASVVIFWSIPALIWANHIASDEMLADAEHPRLASTHGSTGTIALEPVSAARAIQIKVDRTEFVLREDGEIEYDDEASGEKKPPAPVDIQHEDQESVQEMHQEPQYDRPDSRDDAASSIDPAVYERRVLEGHHIM